MIKSFKIDFNGIEEPVEYEDDITFGELEAHSKSMFGHDKSK